MTDQNRQVVSDDDTEKFDWLVILLTVGGFLLGVISFCCFVSYQHIKLHTAGRQSIRKLTLRDSISSQKDQSLNTTGSVTPRRDSFILKRFDDLCEDIV